MANGRSILGSQKILPKYSSSGFLLTVMVPVPRLTHTRATADFLLPVAYVRSSVMTFSAPFSDIERFRLLGLMGMLGAGVHF